MSVRCKKMCAVPGCPELTLGRWCYAHTKNKHISRSYDDRRGSSSARGYDSRWQKLRLVALRRDNFMCQECLKQDRPVPAQEVHHIIGIDVDPSMRLDLDNIISLCAPCHKLITENNQGIFGRKAVNAATKETTIAS